MSIIYSKKIKIVFSKQDALILDGQSKICNWFYNQLLSVCKEDMEKNNNSLRLLDGKNLRNYGVSLKEKYPFLNSVFSSVLKEPSSRLLKAYKSYFKGQTAYPKFRSWKKKWFSLVFDEPDKGWEVLNDRENILISLGKIPGLQKQNGKKNPYVIGKLGEKLKLLNGEIVKTFSVCKQQGNQFYAIFSIERCSQEEIEFKRIMSLYRKDYYRAKKENKKLPLKPQFIKKEITLPVNCKWIALDPNHKNFFVGIDYEGNSIEFSKLEMIKYWDRKIDEIKALRDKCQKKYKVKTTPYMNSYTISSPRWNRLNHTLNRAYHKRREQIKTALYSIAHALYKKYDLVIIGNYTPSKRSASHRNMKRSMLNQEKVGEFRRILEWVSIKSNKYYLIVNEYNTTKKCCVCGHLEKKDPKIRSFCCKNCGTDFIRDVNSSVNIANKAGYSLNINQYKKSLSYITFLGKANYGKDILWINNNINCLA